MKKDSIKVIVKRPGEKPEWQTIPNTLEALQEIVGGYIEAVSPFTDAVIICNEEGRIRGLEYNCDVFGYGFVGTIIFAGVDGEEFDDFPQDIELVNGMIND